MIDNEAKATDHRRKCDHICLLENEHDGPHFYGYEVPSPRVVSDVKPGRGGRMRVVMRQVIIPARALTGGVVLTLEEDEQIVNVQAVENEMAWVYISKPVVSEGDGSDG